MVDRDGTPCASAERKYRSVNFDQLLDLVSGIRGVPETEHDDVELALTALAFGCAPMPPELKACIEAEISLLEKRRVWGAAVGLTTQELDGIDRELDHRRRQLRPRTWVTLDREGKPTLHFLAMGDYCPECSKASRLTAFLVQAMDVLIDAGVPQFRPYGAREQEQDEGVPTATTIDVVNEILDLIGFRPTKRLDASSRDVEAGELEGGIRKPESLFRQYEREQRKLREQRFLLHLPASPTPVEGRYPTPDELRNFVSLCYPGEHGVHILDSAGVGTPWVGEVIWIPMGSSG